MWHAVKCSVVCFHIKSMKICLALMKCLLFHLYCEHVSCEHISCEHVSCEDTSAHRHVIIRRFLRTGFQLFKSPPTSNTHLILDPNTVVVIGITSGVKCICLRLRASACMQGPDCWRWVPDPPPSSISRLWVGWWWWWWGCIDSQIAVNPQRPVLEADRLIIALFHGAD